MYVKHSISNSSKSSTSLGWMQKVNIWIRELAENNIDTTIDWTDSEEKMIKVDSFPQVEKWSSSHFRTLSKDRISLWHYLIELPIKN